MDDHKLLHDFPEIKDHLNPGSILDLPPVTKEEALDRLIEKLCHSESLINCHQIKQFLFARESLMSTGIGYGIAIPHVRLPKIDQFYVAVGRCKAGISYESIDDQPVRLIFLILAPEHRHNEYIRLLSRLMTRIKDKEIVTQLLCAATVDEIYNIIVNTR